ncbi:3-deoxy-7-phosphoheptulonate synthase [Dactylosporangium sp. CA-092794]|uniref:3-deoxy-7-phosphoheptulonate synthase n=1 Tax=Dactylosporangium sp. CA-092794 TaxID=3239929 RepID=UPI003D91EEB4
MSRIDVLYAFPSTVPSTEISEWLAHFESAGADPTLYWLGATPVIAASGTAGAGPTHLTRPDATVRTTGDSRLGRRELRPGGTVVPIGPTRVGDGSIAVFAGPCAVESAEQYDTIAAIVAENGAVGLRGGAFKPRSSPYSFQGLRWAALDLLAETRRKTGLPVLAEVVEAAHVERMAAVADGLQIGARNMQNFELLKEVGAAGMPVVLKRGFGCRVDEVLAAAEYILAAGNDRIVLCERGIRTFETATRFTLDISAVALMKQRSHLPVMVDPSHSTGNPALVGPASLAGVAAGADALLVDVHTDPERALCDGNQALLPAAFRELMAQLESLAMGLGRPLAGAGRLPVPAAGIAVTA